MAKTDWGINDTVMPADMNQMGEEINTTIEAATVAAGVVEAVADELSDATSAATANALVKRDVNGRMKAAAPVASDDVARKAEVDSVGTADAMVDTVVRRDENARFKTATPIAPTDVANKGYVDLILTPPQLAAEIDLNTLTTGGNYMVASPLNGPPGVVYCYLEVIASTTATPRQILTDRGKNKRYIRNRFNNIWSPWVSIIDSNGGKINAPLIVAGNTESRIANSTVSGRSILHLYAAQHLVDGAAINIYGNEDPNAPGRITFFTNGSPRGHFYPEGHFAVIGQFYVGTGAPNGNVTAPIGSIYQRTDGGTGSTLFIKEVGTGNTGWRAV